MLVAVTLPCQTKIMLSLASSCTWGLCWIPVTTLLTRKVRPASKLPSKRLAPRPPPALSILLSCQVMQPPEADNERLGKTWSPGMAPKMENSAPLLIKGLGTKLATSVTLLLSVKLKLALVLATSPAALFDVQLVKT